MSITDIRQAVLTGDAEGAADLARAELEAGTAPAVIMNDALISAMDEAGAKMATGELFIPEVLVASEAMRAAMDVITPHLEVEATGGRGTVVIGAVEGDVHAARKVVLHKTARVTGNITTPCLVVEEGAVINGTFKMVTSDGKAPASLKAIDGGARPEAPKPVVPNKL